jgi:hypothetical protein
MRVRIRLGSSERTLKKQVFGKGEAGSSVHTSRILASGLRLGVQRGTKNEVMLKRY